VNLPAPQNLHEAQGEPHHDFRPDRPSEPPPELAEFLKGQPIAALLHATENQGTVMVVKAPRREIRSVQGRVPIELRHELYHHPLAPVIRIYDRPDSSFGLETFVNVEDPDQRSDYATLAQQDELHLLFYDERLQHRLTKRVGQDRTDLQGLLAQADWLLGTIRPERFDFDRAKADVMARTAL
jgi:hypothetical protein